MNLSSTQAASGYPSNAVIATLRITLGGGYFGSRRQFGAGNFLIIHCGDPRFFSAFTVVSLLLSF